MSNLYSRLSKEKKGALLMILTAFLWSTGGLFIKLIPVNALTILFYRSTYAAIVFVLLFQKKIYRVNKISIFASIVYAALLISFVSATKLTTAANAIFLQYTGAIYILLLEPIFFKTKLKRLDVTTVIVCMLGMLLFFIGDMDLSNLRGILIACASGLLLAFFFLAQKMNTQTYHASAIFWGNIIVLFISFNSFIQSPVLTFSQHALLAFLGFIQIGLAYAIYTFAISKISAFEVSILGMIEPLLNPIWVAIGYGEIPTLSSIFGGIIIIFMLILRMFLIEKMKPE